MGRVEVNAARLRPPEFPDAAFHSGIQASTHHACLGSPRMDLWSGPRHHA